MNRGVAEALGWTLEIDGEDGVARKKGKVTLDVDNVLQREPDTEFQVTSGIPLFSMLREIAELEGQPIKEPVTPELVAALSGERYEEPEPPAPEIVEAPVRAVPAAVSRLLMRPADEPVTAGELATVLQELLVGERA